MEEKVNITLYSKPGCHLCDEVREFLILLSGIVDFKFETLDITADKQLFKKYQYDIPVVCVNGEEVVRHRINQEKCSKIIQSIKKHRN